MTQTPENIVKELARVLKAALDQTGCDGDLCGYRWHEDARKVLEEFAESHARLTASPTVAANDPTRVPQDVAEGMAEWQAVAMRAVPTGAGEAPSETRRVWRIIEDDGPLIVVDDGKQAWSHYGGKWHPPSSSCHAAYYVRAGFDDVRGLAAAEVLKGFDGRES